MASCEHLTEEWTLWSLFVSAAAWWGWRHTTDATCALPTSMSAYVLRWLVPILHTTAAAEAHCAHRPFPHYRNQQEPALTPPPALGVAEKHRRRDPVVVVGR